MAIAVANKQLNKIIPGYDAQGNVISLVLEVSYDLVDPSTSPPNLIQRVGVAPDVWPQLNAGHRQALTQVLTRLLAIKDTVTP